MLTYQGNNRLRLLILSLPFLFLVTPSQGKWLEKWKIIGNDTGIYDWDNYDYFGFPVSLSENNVFVGAIGDDQNGQNAGACYIFSNPCLYCDVNWIEKDKLVPIHPDEYECFGRVAADGDYLIVGAPYDSEQGQYSGSAHVFFYNGKDWTQQARLSPPDIDAEHHFGLSVAIKDNYAVVGAPWGDGVVPGAGAAYMFKREGTEWIYLYKLYASDGSLGDNFGCAVDLSAEFVVIGAEYDDESGSAYVFQYARDSGLELWSEYAKLMASDGKQDDHFGISVSIHSLNIIVGALDYVGPLPPPAGTAYIFKLYNDTWKQHFLLRPSDGYGKGFGFAVSVYEDGAIVGASCDSEKVNNGGAVYYYRQNRTGWVLQQKLIPSDISAGMRFGMSVSMNKQFLAAGAPNQPRIGSVYIFNRECPTADITGDCSVDYEDFSIMASQWMQIE